nr:hypothetical protein [Streptomyces brevispora]
MDGPALARGGRLPLERGDHRGTVYVWIAGLALRAALYGVAAVLGIHQGSPALMMALAVTLLVRSGVLARRAAEIPASFGGPADGAPFRQAWKDRV